MNVRASDQSPTVAERRIAPLLEREDDLARLDGLIARASAGEGTVALIEASAGLGKTRLLDELHTRARSMGFLVLTGRGGEIEREFAFGLVRQALEPWLAHADEHERAEVMSGAARFAAPVFADAEAHGPSDPDPGYAVMHGLYWVCANVAVRKPLLLSFDDAHWIDLPTLRFLSFLGRRLAGVQALVMLAARPGEPGAGPLSELVVELDPPVVRPGPLSQAATASLIRAKLGGVVGADLCAAGHEVSAGNPFLLAELIKELDAQDRRLDQIPADWVRRLGPERIARSVLIRIGRLSPEAVILARAIAVLGGEAEMRHAASLAGVSLAEATPIVDSLVSAAVLDHTALVGFVHPLVRTAVYEDTPAGERARLHAAAASLFAGEGAAPEPIAAHLLASEPDGQPWVVETLRRAADAALARGTPEPAVSFLRRALAEPPTGAERARLLLALGSAELGAGDPAALEHLEEAVASATDQQERAVAALQLGRAMNAASRSVEAVGIFERAIEELGDRDPELSLWLEGELLGTAWYEASTQPLIMPRVDRLRERVKRGRSAPERLVLANLAIGAAARGESADDAARLAERALEAADFAVETHAFYLATLALLFSDGLELGERGCAVALEAAQTSGSIPFFAIASCVRSLVAYRHGSLAAAEANARSSLDVSDPGVWPVGLPLAVAALIDPLIERGELEVAREALASPELDELLAIDRPPITVNHLLDSRGRFRIAAGEVREGLDDLLLCGRRWEEWGIANPAIVAWRSSAAMAHAALGEEQEARRLATEELELARRFGAPRAVGVALRVVALLAGGRERIEQLTEAERVLERTPASLEHARVLVDLGVALRHAGRRRDASDKLGGGMDRAHRLGATVLAERAREELRLAGARPRRLAISGRDALTPAELRVAEAADSGMSNREIAQALFVTLRTVEMHLTNAYRKLEIGSRRELGAAMAGPGTPD